MTSTFFRSLTAATFLAASVSGIPLAQAATLSLSSEVPLSTTNYSKTLSIPKFDLNLGTLTGITIDVTGNILGTAKIENRDAAIANVTTKLSALLELQGGLGNSQLVAFEPSQSFQDSLEASTRPDSEESDYKDPFTSRVYSDVSATDQKSISYTDNASIGFFSSSIPNDQSVFTLKATGTSAATGAGNVDQSFRLRAGGTVKVSYSYEPKPTPTPTPTPTPAPTPTPTPIPPTDNQSKDVPEPTTMLGAAIALGLGAMAKRKQDSSRS